MVTPHKHKSPDSLTAVQLGQRGGRSRASKLTPERRSEIARTAAQARWPRFTLGALDGIGDLPVRIRGFSDTIEVLSHELVEHPQHGRHIVLTIDMLDLTSQALKEIRSAMDQASAQRESDFDFIRARTGVNVNKTILCRAMARANGVPVSRWSKLPMRMLESLAAEVLRNGAGTEEAARLIAAIKTESDRGLGIV